MPRARPHVALLVYNGARLHVQSFGMAAAALERSRRLLSAARLDPTLRAEAEEELATASPAGREG